MKPEQRPEQPLPATAWFVTFLGVFIAVGWFLMYLLMRSRW